MYQQSISPSVFQNNVLSYDYCLVPVLAYGPEYWHLLHLILCIIMKQRAAMHFKKNLKESYSGTAAMGLTQLSVKKHLRCPGGAHLRCPW